jgi:hypothetical protein
MRLIKVLGLAAVAVLTAMAFIGMSSSLEKLLLLSQTPVLEPGLTVKCEDAIGTLTLVGRLSAYYRCHSM